MPNPRSSSSLSSSTIEPTKRRLVKHRDLWLQFFSDALAAMLPNERDDITGISESDAQIIVQSAGRIADAALTQTEERFKGL